jgi:hypothetical protein
LRLSVLFVSVCAALALAGAARSGLSLGVSEDRGKSANPAAFFATLNDLGLTQNRASIVWDPAQPNTIAGQAEIQHWLPLAQAAGIRVVFAIAPKDAHAITGSPNAVGQFAAFVQHVARTFPQVREFVVGNEPNQPYFWQPQYDAAGKPLSGAAYEPLLAQSYDALKAVNPAIDVIGIGLSPRGNDNPRARNNISRSPVRFLHDVGVAYRASGRTKPLMDELAFHPYPHVNTDSPEVGYTWPNAGIPNLGRIKQAVWDAFNGTAQPTFAESGTESMSPLRLELDEIGWEVAIDPSLAPRYTGQETKPPIDEQTQAEYYAQVIQSAECDASISSLSFFLLEDEPNLARWQSGLERIDGSRRPSYGAVKQTIAQTGGNCQQVMRSWKHTKKVVVPRVVWGKLKRSRRNTRWSFVAGAGEEALYRAGIFKAGTSKRKIARSLLKGRPKPILAARGTIKARTRVVRFPSRRLRPGRYVFAIRMRASMNTTRASLVISRVVRVGAR